MLPTGSLKTGYTEEVMCVWRYRLTVRTEPSQGLNRGSIPLSATMILVTYSVCGQQVASTRP